MIAVTADEVVTNQIIVLDMDAARSDKWCLYERNHNRNRVETTALRVVVSQMIDLEKIILDLEKIIQFASRTRQSFRDDGTGHFRLTPNALTY